MAIAKFPRRTVGISVISILVFCFSAAHAGWRLCDNFNTGNAADPSKWRLSQTGAVSISIENGQLKFETASGVIDLSEHAVILKMRNKIQGI